MARIIITDILVFRRTGSLEEKLLILAVGPWYPGNAYHWLVQGFEQLGHKVIRIGPLYKEHMGVKWALEDIDEPTFLLPRETPLWNFDQFVDLCTDAIETPDLLIASEETYRTEIVPTNKIPTVLISYDGWPQNYERRDLFKPIKAYSNHIGIRIHPRDEVPEGWEWLPPAYAPWVHKLQRPLLSSREYDFSLIATMYGDRPKLCEYLKSKFHIMYGQCNTASYVRVYNNTLCTLHNPQPGEIKWRAYEGMAMGCIQISWDVPIFRKVEWEPNVHYFPIGVKEEGNDPWPTGEQLAEAINYLNTNPGLADYIRERSFRRVVEQDTYYHRCEKILSDLRNCNVLQ